MLVLRPSALRERTAQCTQKVRHHPVDALKSGCSFIIDTSDESTISRTLKVENVTTFVGMLTHFEIREIAPTVASEPNGATKPLGGEPSSVSF